MKQALHPDIAVRAVFESQQVACDGWILVHAQWFPNRENASVAV
jgi:hypothetical protein